MKAGLKIRKFNLRSVVFSTAFAPSIAIILICIYLLFATDRFFTVSNLMNLARAISMTSILAVGMTMVIIVAGIDLSVGSAVAFTAIMSAMVLSATNNPLLAILTALAMGTVVGTANGLLVAYMRLPAFVVTMGMSSMLRGMALVSTGGWPINLYVTAENGWYFFLGGGYIFNTIPMQAVVMIIILIVGAVLLRRTVFGNNLYAVGGNERAATLAGISTKKVKMMAYTILGFFAGIVGVLTASYVQSAQPTLAIDMEANVIAAAVIGGCALSGGEGSIPGTLMGSITIGVLLNGLTILGVSANYQKIGIGFVIIMAVILSELMKSARNRVGTLQKR